MASAARAIISENSIRVFAQNLGEFICARMTSAGNSLVSNFLTKPRSIASIGLGAPTLQAIAMTP